MRTTRVTIIGYSEKNEDDEASYFFVQVVSTKRLVEAISEYRYLSGLWLASFFQVNNVLTIEEMAINTIVGCQTITTKDALASVVEQFFLSY